MFRSKNKLENIAKEHYSFTTLEELEELANDEDWDFKDENLLSMYRKMFFEKNSLEMNEEKMPLYAKSIFFVGLPIMWLRIKSSQKFSNKLLNIEIERRKREGLE